MNAAKIIRHLQKISDETFVAAGKFVPRDVVVGTTADGALGEIPRVVYVGVTDSEVILVNGTSKKLLRPTRPRAVLARWRRSEVRVIATLGVADIVAEFDVPDADLPIQLICRRLDGSAKNVVRLLTSHNHAHDRLSPVDTDAGP